MFDTFPRALFSPVMLACLALFSPATLTIPAQVSNSDFEIRSFQLMSSNQAHLTLTTPSDHTYRFLFSTNLLNWRPAGPLPPVSFDGKTATYLVEVNPQGTPAMFQVEYRSATPNPEPIIQLQAPANELVTQHLPTMGLPFENEMAEVEVRNNVPVSLAHVLVTFEAATTVQSLNDLLASEDLTLAGTVPAMNLGVLRRRLVTNLEDMQALVDRLSASGLFRAAALNLGLSQPRDMMGPPVNAALGQSPLVDWTWEVVGLGQGFSGNNALEMSRIPQLWNWLDYGHRQKPLQGGHRVAVLEFAFNPHQDLDTNVVLESTSDSSLDQSDYDHGIAVLGIVAAKHNIGGTQGVTPLPDEVKGVVTLLNTTSTHVYSGVFLGQMASLLSSANAPKVINISSGIRWTNPPTLGNQIWMDDLGGLWASCFETLNRHLANTDYLVVCSAGNDDGVDAAYNSPMANIACRPELHVQAPQFLTVENVRKDRTSNPSSNFDASGRGHAVSAGGTDVTVLQGPGTLDYRVEKSGTSYSAPLVSGLASFLWSLEPSLTISEIKSLLLSSNTTFEVQSGERANLVDGFSAALDIDRLRQSLDLQRALVDVDDGTLDGNLREEIIYFSEDPDQIHTEDGRRGDGFVNMKDFRVFRDAWLHVIGETPFLDGPPAHFKRDLNFDGLVFDQPADPPHPAPYFIGFRPGVSLLENVYSRYDYNGNGLLDSEMQSSSAPVASLSPFKADPDTPFTRRDVSQGILRDIDVLLDRNIWEQDEENVLVTGSYSNPTDPPEGWSTNAMQTLFVNYLKSFDLHVAMEGGNPEASHDVYDEYPVFAIQDGLRVDSLFNLIKARSGAWEGVVTIPFTVLIDVPTVALSYKKTVGDEFHQYVIRFLPGLGEDIALAVGFEELQFYSNTREFAAFHLEGSSNAESEEIIAKRPNAGTYGNVFVPLEEHTTEEVEKRARDLAVAALGERLLFPVALNGSPSLEPIFRTRSEAGGVLLEVYGIRAKYNTIVGTPVP